MNKFKHKSVPRSTEVLRRQSLADSQRFWEKVEKRQPVTIDVRWQGLSAATTSTVEPDEWAGYTTVDEVVTLDQDDYKRLGNYFDWLLKPTTVNNGNGTYTHSFRLRSVSFDAAATCA